PRRTYAQEKHKVEVRWPAAVKFIRENRLNEVFEGEIGELGIVCQGGMYNVAVRALQQLGFADTFGNSRIPIYVLNVAYPLIPEEVGAFCSGKFAVLMIEEGQPAYLEDALHAVLRRADLGTKVHGKDFLPMAGEYTGEVVLAGVAKWLTAMAPRLEKARIDSGGIQRVLDTLSATKRRAAELLGAGARAAAGVLHRLPGAAGVLGDEADRARVGRVSHLRRHRLPYLLHPAPVQHRQHRARLRPGARLELRHRTDVLRAHRHHHGRRRFLAQRPHLGDRQRGVQQ